MTEIPADISKQINDAAIANWPDDREMQKHFIRTERVSYAAVMQLDFETAAAVNEQILESANATFETWEERFGFIKEQINAYAALQSIDFSGLPEAAGTALRARAAEENDGDFDLQVDFIRKGIARFHEIAQLRAEIAPIRELLTRMESVIGNECYNGNIQNYGPFGEWQGEGRSFRYPVTFIKDGEELKRHSLFTEFADELLITGRYKFGANELSIFRALIKIINMLKSEYGLTLPPKDAQGRP